MITTAAEVSVVVATVLFKITDLKMIKYIFTNYEQRFAVPFNKSKFFFLFMAKSTIFIYIFFSEVAIFA